MEQDCADQLYRLRNSDKKDEKAVLQQQRANAVAAAVEALSKLHSREIREKLNAFIKTEEDKTSVLASDTAQGQNASTSSSAQTAKSLLSVGHEVTFLNNRAPLFWHNCFVRLFPRGDCAERCSEKAQTFHASVIYASTSWVTSTLTCYCGHTEIIGHTINQNDMNFNFFVSDILP